MASQGMLSEIRETRRELARLNSDLAKLGSEGANKGKTFGQKFKNAALTGIKEMAKGAAAEVGVKLVQKFFSTGESGGKSYGRGFKKAAKKELDTLSANPAAAGMKGLNVGALPVIGAGILAAAIASQVGAALQPALEKERLQISFNALSADGVGGSRIFEALRSDAMRTGQEIESMASTVQRFLGLGFAEEDALKLQDSLLDIAGALGMTTTESALLGSALAQVKAKGVASMEELRQQIAEKGVPVFQVLAEKIGVSEAAIIDMVSTGKLGADTVIEAFMNLEGPLERFRGGADRLAASAGGLFERMARQGEDLKRAFGEALIPELKLVLTDSIGLIERMKAGAAEFGKIFADGIGWVATALDELSLFEMLRYAAAAFREGMWQAFDLTQKGAYALVKTLAGDEFENAMTRGALAFKAIMLAVMKEIAGAMKMIMPDNYVGRKMRGFFGNAEASLEGGATAASDAFVSLPRTDWQKVADSIKENFKNAPSAMEFSGYQNQTLDEFNAKMKAGRARRQQRITAAGAAETPTQRTGGSSAAITTAPQMGGLLAGGLANAISRISGGASTLLMTRQLDVLREVKTATNKTAAAAEKTVAAVNALPSRLGPLWS
jgi:tape measure domain-containing protein